MTIAEMSIREALLAGEKLEEPDLIRLKDKKRKKYRGIFVPARHMKKIENIILQEEEEERQKKLDKLMEFAGMATGVFRNKSFQELKGERKI
jgi:sporulation protein YlmC with PRC-barrel domain